MQNFFSGGAHKSSFFILHSAFCISPMSDPAPNPELLRSLGRLVRGLSALFWGLPTTLIVCAGTASAGWFEHYGLVPPLATTGLLMFGLWQMGAFQKQERPWREALDRARLFGLVNFGLSPFLCWWNRLPEQPFFTAALCVFAFSSLLFLFELNFVLQRLGAMLPDETLRHETRQYTAFNRTLLISLLGLAATYLLCSRLLPTYFPQLTFLPAPSEMQPVEMFGHQISVYWLIWLTLCLLVLLPLAMTMALIWKTNEVILDSVFGAK
jgi:hypothetical protein